MLSLIIIIIHTHFDIDLSRFMRKMLYITWNKRKIFKKIKIFHNYFVQATTWRRLFDEIVCFHNEVICTRFARAIKRNHSRHFLVNENWINKSVFINHFVTILRTLSISSNWRKSCVLTTKNMLLRVWLCSNRKERHVL
jgi:hypothetical protein